MVKNGILRACTMLIAVCMYGNLRADGVESSVAAQ